MNFQNKITIYIDESGTLPDVKDTVVIVAAVGTARPADLKRVTKTTRIRQKTIITNEIKFYRSGEKTKTRFLTNLKKLKPDIFVLIVEKSGKSIADTPENFALLCWQLLEDCFAFYIDGVKELVFDRHFHKDSDQLAFDKAILNLLGSTPIINHLDSLQNPEINAADMIAGAVLWAKTQKTDRFYKIIKDIILVEKTINWKEIKRKFWTQKNARTGASTHPDI